MLLNTLCLASNSDLKVECNLVHCEARCGRELVVPSWRFFPPISDIPSKFLMLRLVMQVGSDNDLRQAGSLPTAVQRPNVRTSAVAHFAPPPAMEMAEDVMEASFARGLASAECFEVSSATSIALSRAALCM